jgi:hypothetical protein
MSDDDITDDLPLAERPLEACDSAIEDAFFWEFRKVAHDDIRMRRQEECHTDRGTYRLDFLFYSQINGDKVAVECDGKNFHSVTRDSQRDAAIIRSGVVDKIVRIAGKDIWWRLHDVLQMIAAREPWLFSERGIDIIDLRAARKHQREDGWSKGLDKFYFHHTRWYERPDPENEVSYESEFHEYAPSNLLWATTGT